MCCLINKIKNWFLGKKEVCDKRESVILNEASLSKEEVDSVIINSIKKSKEQKKIKPKIKSKKKPKSKNIKK